MTAREKIENMTGIELAECLLGEKGYEDYDSSLDIAESHDRCDMMDDCINLELLLDDDYSGHYCSVNEFISKNCLENEANELFGEGWEPENDIEQIQMLLDSIDEDYNVKAIEETTERDKRADDYIIVTS